MISKLKKRKKSEWTIHWLDQSKKIEKLMEQFIMNHPLFSEMKLVRTLTKIIPESHALFLGNSLPVREVDFYGSKQGSEVKVGLNRGASGIDGLDKSCIIEVNTLKEDNIRVQKEWTEFLHQNR